MIVKKGKSYKWKNTAYAKDDLKLSPNIIVYTVYFILSKVIGVAREIVIKVEFWKINNRFLKKNRFFSLKYHYHWYNKESRENPFELLILITETDVTYFSFKTICFDKLNDYFQFLLLFPLFKQILVQELVQNTWQGV